jgi:hypothetical protein
MEGTVAAQDEFYRSEYTPTPCLSLTRLPSSRPPSPTPVLEV